MRVIGLLKEPWRDAGLPGPPRSISLERVSATPAQSEQAEAAEQQRGATRLGHDVEDDVRTDELDLRRQSANGAEETEGRAANDGRVAIEERVIPNVKASQGGESKVAKV